MDFRFTDEQELFRATTAKFVDAEVAPLAEHLDRTGEFPAKLIRRIGELGYFGLRYPEAYGGLEADNVTYCIFAEEMARGSMAVAATAAMQSLMGTYFVYAYGSEEVRQQYLVPAIRGEKIGTFAITEPNAGSDISGIETLATRDGDRYILTGRKTWITNAVVADFFTIAAKTRKERGMESICLFLLDKGTPGFAVGKEIDKLGARGSQTTEIILDGCPVPATYRLGEEEQGVRYLGTILNEIRVMTAALSVGIARAAYDAALRYANERTAFGNPIAKYQAIKFKLADMATALHASKLLTYHAAWMLDQKLPVTKEAAMAKLFASEAACQITDEATRIYGSYGFAMEYPVQRYLRDARFLLYGGGTSEILRIVIGKEIGA
ncbi:MAG: acyl-CoA dehydrogenase family protein [Deltaproteobacteria bacterium]|nr:acyl-CoA dehydrogenase family protein [Deltaproteobacteria bacterium]